MNLIFNKIVYFNIIIQHIWISIHVVVMVPCEIIKLYDNKRTKEQLISFHKLFYCFEDTKLLVTTL